MNSYVGPARAVVDDRDVGEWRVELHSLDPNRDDARDARSWGGRVTNSDYVLWGMAGRKLRLVLPDGRAGECVVRPAGEILGFGPPPFASRPNETAPNETAPN